MKTAVGFSIHTGWVVAVVVGGSPTKLLARKRIEISNPNSRFIYHEAAEQSRAAGRIANAKRRARLRAKQELSGLVKEYSIQFAAFPPKRRELPKLDSILKSHSLIHSAEGALYREAMEYACKELGLKIETPTPKTPTFNVKTPPWGKDQKNAAALAWSVLRSK